MIFFPVNANVMLVAKGPYAYVNLPPESLVQAIGSWVSVTDWDWLDDREVPTILVDYSTYEWGFSKEEYDEE